MCITEINYLRNFKVEKAVKFIVKLASMIPQRFLNKIPLMGMLLNEYSKVWRDLVN